MYFVGDRNIAMRKWRQKWTGPWLIHEIINDTTLIIADESNGNKKRVNFDRIRLFKESDYQRYFEVFGDYHNYDENYNKLRKRFSKFNVKHVKPKVILDYRKNTVV